MAVALAPSPNWWVDLARPNGGMHCGDGRGNSHCHHLAAAAAARPPAACRRYGAHTADWAPGQGLYAYGAQNTVVLLNSRAKVVRTLLSGHTNR